MDKAYSITFGALSTSSIDSFSSVLNDLCCRTALIFSFFLSQDFQMIDTFAAQIVYISYCDCLRPSASAMSVHVELGTPPPQQEY